MIAVEARWVGSALAALPDERLFPLLNVGSQDEEFRKQRQRWIDRRVFAPLRQRGGTIVHLDLAPGEGVDIAGDLLDPAVRARLGGFRSVLCANVLEHVPDREQFAAALVDVVAPGGYLIVTVPHRFPYHPDPIDTKFRPEIDELAALFPTLEVVRSRIVRSTMLAYLFRRVLMLPFEKRQAVSDSSATRSMRGEFLRWILRRISATCVVLRKPL
jgi:SAM-dependent methyltransferase